MASLRRALALSMMEAQEPVKEESQATASISSVSSSSTIEKTNKESNAKNNKKTNRERSQSQSSETSESSTFHRKNEKKKSKQSLTIIKSNSSSSDESSSSSEDFEFPPSVAIKNRRYSAHIGGRVKVHVEKSKWQGGKIVKIFENKVKIVFDDGTSDNVNYPDEDKVVVMDAPPPPIAVPAISSSPSSLTISETDSMEKIKDVSEVSTSKVKPINNSTTTSLLEVTNEINKKGKSSMKETETSTDKDVDRTSNSEMKKHEESESVSENERHKDDSYTAKPEVLFSSKAMMKKLKSEKDMARNTPPSCPPSPNRSTEESVPKTRPTNTPPPPTTNTSVDPKPSQSAAPIDKKENKLLKDDNAKLPSLNKRKSASPPSTSTSTASSDDVKKGKVLFSADESKKKNDKTNEADNKKISAKKIVKKLSHDKTEDAVEKQDDSRGDATSLNKKLSTKHKVKEDDDDDDKEDDSKVKKIISATKLSEKDQDRNEGDDDEGNEENEEEGDDEEKKGKPGTKGSHKKKRDPLELSHQKVLANFHAPPSRVRKGVQRFAPSMKPDWQLLKEKEDLQNEVDDYSSSGVGGWKGNKGLGRGTGGKGNRKTESPEGVSSSSTLISSKETKMEMTSKSALSKLASVNTPAPASGYTEQSIKELNRPSRHAAKLANTRIMKRENPEAASLAEISTFGLTTQQQKAIPVLSPRQQALSTSTSNTSGSPVSSRGGEGDGTTSSGGLIRLSPPNPNPSLHGHDTIPIATMTKKSIEQSDNVALQFKGSIQYKGSMVRGASNSSNGSVGRGSGSSRKEEEKWAQCERCEKWRKLPSFVNTGALPEKWYCEMNEWDSKRNNCDASEESDTSHKKTSRPVKLEWVQCDGCEKWRRIPQSAIANLPEQWYCTMNKWDSKHNSCNAPEEAAALEETNQSSSSSSVKKAGKEVNEWVQCDQCAKWRRLPFNIDPNTLPDEWSCAMNWWDSLNASCSAPQEVEKDEDKEERKAARAAAANRSSSRSTGNMLSQHNADNKLGFREILFHVDGKIRPPFSEKSLMSSIFTVGKDKHASAASRNPDIESYFLSTAYQEPEHHSAASKKRKYLELIQKLPGYVSSRNLQTNLSKNMQNMLIFDNEDIEIKKQIEKDNEESSSDEDDDENDDVIDENDSSSKGSCINAFKDEQKAKDDNDKEKEEEVGTSDNDVTVPRMSTLAKHAQLAFKVFPSNTRSLASTLGKSGVRSPASTTPNEEAPQGSSSMLTMSVDSFLLPSPSNEKQQIELKFDETPRIDHNEMQLGDKENSLFSQSTLGLNDHILNLLSGERRQCFAQLLLSLHCLMNQNQPSALGVNNKYLQNVNQYNPMMGLNPTSPLGFMKTCSLRSEQGTSSSFNKGFEMLKDPLDPSQVQRALKELIAKNLIIQLPPDQSELEVTYMLRNDCSNVVLTPDAEYSGLPRSRKPWKKKKLHGDSVQEMPNTLADDKATQRKQNKDEISTLRIVTAPSSFVGVNEKKDENGIDVSSQHDKRKGQASENSIMQAKKRFRMEGHENEHLGAVDQKDVLSDDGWVLVAAPALSDQVTDMTPKDEAGSKLNHSVQEHSAQPVPVQDSVHSEQTKDKPINNEKMEVDPPPTPVQLQDSLAPSPHNASTKAPLV